MTTDLPVELRAIRTAFRALISSSRTARFAWTGEAATLQYQATRRGQAALERLEELEPSLVAPKPGAVDEAAVRAVRAAVEAVQWDRADEAPQVGELVRSVEALLRLLPRAGT